MKCIFLRHGIAADREAWTGADADRPLTEAGIERMKREAKALATRSLGVERIVTSPLVRAAETAAVEDVILEAHPDIESIMLVGHEPTMSETIGELIGGGRIDLKKGGIACVEIPNRKMMRGTLLWLAPPKMLV